MTTPTDPQGESLTPTPRTHALLRAIEAFGVSDRNSVLITGLRQLETELAAVAKDRDSAREAMRVTEDARKEWADKAIALTEERNKLRSRIEWFVVELNKSTALNGNYSENESNLSAERDRLRAENARLKAWVEKRGHAHGCVAHNHDGICDCGLFDALAQEGAQG